MHSACKIVWLVLASLLLTKTCAVEEDRLDVGFKSGETNTFESRKQLDRKSLEIKGDRTSDPDLFPLQDCEGRCTDHEECAGDLQCFARTGYESVPGCMGMGESDMGYCYNTTASQTSEPTAFPTSSPSIPPEPTSDPTGLPTEEPTLYPTITFAPTTSPTSAPSRGGLIDFQDGRNSFGKCEGRCENDEQCRGDLLCQKRGGYEFVPGCNGFGIMGSNYCYDPADGDAPVSLPDGDFRLRLYWQNGYRWQEDPSERRYCLQEGDPAQIQNCGGGSTRFRFVYLPGPGDQIRIAGGSGRCLTRTGDRYVAFQGCDDNNMRQRWTGIWTMQRFDISPALKDGCLTNHHHPKPGEQVYVDKCYLAHRVDTGFWNILR